MCTAVRFTDEAGHLFWGRNYDWNVTYGEKPVIMPKGFTIKCYFDSPVQAEHAVIGMAVDYHGYPLFFNCGNDAGLAVGGLNFAGYAQFAPGPVEGKTNIAAYEVPVWVAANFSTVDEVEAALEDTVIVDAQVGLDMPVVPLEWRLENLRNCLACTGSWPETAHWRGVAFTPFGTGSTMRGIPGDYHAPSRFVKAAFVNAFYPQKAIEQDNVMHLIHMLGSVAFTEGCARMEDGSSEVPLFSDCFSAATGTYYYNTVDDPALRCACLADYANADPSAWVEPEVKLCRP